HRCGAHFFQFGHGCAGHRQFSCGEIVSPANERLARALLRYASPLRFLRRLPVLGNRLSWLGERIVPRDTRTWAQVENGPAAGIWLRLNPRTGLDVLRGAGEPEV